MWRQRVVLVVGCLLVVVGSFLPLTPVHGVAAVDDAEIESDPRWAQLERLGGADRIVTLDFYDVRLDEVLTALADVAGLEVRLQKGISDEPRTFLLNGKSLRQALVEVGSETGIYYDIETDGALVVLVPAIAGENGVTSPERIVEAYVPPVYPEEARKAGVQARVFLQAVVGTDGSVGDLTVLKAERPDFPAFEQNAVDAVAQWRYRPATKDGKPVLVYMTLIVEYKLD
jgi:TonB family protein